MQASFRVLCLLFLIAAAALQRLRANELEYQLDAYYAAVDYYLGLTRRPIPHYEFKSEADIYKRLIFSSPVPRFMLLEASVNPLPLLGVWTRRQAPHFYRGMQAGESNLVRSVTTGFEEPWAASVFLGQIVDFKPTKKRRYAEGRGHVGYLVSAGNYHIKDNDMVKDDWVEAEWKVKGDRIFPDMKLHWSFRVGAKSHANREVADVYYVGIRRSRTDYRVRRLSWINNSGVMYKFDFRRSNLAAVQHHLVVDKKFPLGKGRLVPSLSLGFIRREKDKYSGSLRDRDPRSFEFLFQPNLEF